MSKVATDCRYSELGRIRVTLSVTYSTHPNDKWDKKNIKKIKKRHKSHHAKELFVVSTHPHTCMFRQHVDPHLASRDLLQIRVLLTVHAVPNKVMLRQNLFGASMAKWVVHEVQGRLTVQVDSDRGNDYNIAFHLELELTKKSGLLPCHCESHVFAFAGA